MSEIQVRAAQAGEYGAVQAVFGGAMMFDPKPDELWQQLFEPDRALVATRAG